MVVDNLSINFLDENIITFKPPFDTNDKTNPLEYLEKGKYYCAIAYSSSVTGAGLLIPAYATSWRATVAHAVSGVTTNLSWDTNGFRAWGNTSDIVSVVIKELIIK